ncbi:MAG: nuclear transport factor 2 family protein [Pseudomonadota bacterium]
MKARRNAFVLALIAATTTLSAPSLVNDEGREAAVKAAELARFKANVEADATALGLLLADDLDYVHSNGDVDTKASFIESLTSGRRDYIAMTTDMQKVRVFGDVAVIRGLARVTVATDGKSQELAIGYTDTWVWKDQRWQMAAWHSSRYAVPAAPAK